MKLSIILPSRNEELLMRSAIVDIYRYLRKKGYLFEILVVINGSTDGTVNIIKKYAQKYPDIIFWESKKDKGQVDAINKGLKKVSGDIVAYINADDVYEKEALLKVGEYFVNNPKTLWLAGKGRVINSEGKEISKWVTVYKNVLLAINRYTLLLTVNYVMQPSVFISKKAYKKYGPFIGTRDYVMEYDLWLKLGKAKMPNIVNEYLSKFRLTMENVSAIQFKSVLTNDFRLVKKYTKNPLILLLHKINNLGRIVNILLMKRV